MPLSVRLSVRVGGDFVFVHAYLDFGNNQEEMLYRYNGMDVSL
jgi:hypothetical protein